MIIKWTEKKKAKVLSIIEDYILEHKVTSGESVMQMDEPQIEAAPTLAEIVDIVKPKLEEND